jgi:hypothetical protein
MLFCPGVPLDAYSASRNDMPSGPGLLLNAATFEILPFTTSEKLVTVIVTILVEFDGRDIAEKGTIPWAAFAEQVYFPDIIDKKAKSNMAKIILTSKILLSINIILRCRDAFYYYSKFPT